MELREITYLAVALRSVAAVLIGGLLGLERGLNNRAAGMRTYMLVCMGSCLVMMTNQYIYQVFGTGDPVRMGAQVISGIGFLGAGTIIVTRRSQIKGLTTAAGLWAAAGVGLALGIGFYEAAVAGALAIFVVMTLMRRWDDLLHGRNRTLELYLELEDTLPLGDLLRSARDMGLEISNIQRETAVDAQLRAYILLVRLPKRRNHAQVLDTLQRLQGVAYLEEL